MEWIKLFATSTLCILVVLGIKHIILAVVGTFVRPAPQPPPPEPMKLSPSPPPPNQPERYAVAADVIISLLKESIELQKKTMAAVYGTNLAGVQVMDDAESKIRVVAEELVQRYGISMEEAIGRARVIASYRS